MKFILKTAAIIFIMAVSCRGAKAINMEFRTGTAVELSPSDAIQRIYFDHDGLMWICTSAGLKSYDGYSLKTYKSGVIRTQIFPNNFVMSVTADNDDFLYIGTHDGLVRMNRRTDECKTYQPGMRAQNIVYELYTTKDGTVWAGTDRGTEHVRPQERQVCELQLIERGARDSRRTAEAPAQLLLGEVDKGKQRREAPLSW